MTRTPSFLQLALYAFTFTGTIAAAACAGGGGRNGDDDDDDVVAIDAAIGTDAAVAIDAPMSNVDAGIDAAPLAGDLCTSAEPVTLTGGVGTTSISATTAGYTNDYQPGVCTDTNSPGADRVYVVSVGPGNRLIATVTPTADTFDPGVFLVGAPAASCDAATITCLGAADSGGDGDEDTAIYKNTTNAAVDVYIIIDGFRAVGDAYTLGVTVGPTPPTQPGDTCTLGEAVTLVNGMATVLGTTSTITGYENNYAPDDTGGCTGYEAPGNDRVHTVTVPARQRVTATVTPTVDTFDVGLYFVATPAATCDVSPLVCRGGHDEGFEGDAETAIYENATAAPVDLYVVVDSYNPGGDGYMLGVVTGPAPAGETCTTAESIDVSSGAAAVTGTTVGYLNHHDPSDYPNGDCTTWRTTGPDRLYTLSIPGQRTLSVTMTPEEGYDAGVYLIAGPAASCSAAPVVCLAGDDSNYDGEAETIAYTNSGTAAIEVFLGVDGDAGNGSGTFTLALTVAP
ncbi:MAG TPA: hypothetical protein VM261_05260 [Kofleriaceae bacterium]|nr:hypothetical protein [Kofleriaceae bacterium]